MAPKTKKKVSIAVPVEEHHGYEFFGPPGVTVLTIGLPLLTYAFTLLCNDSAGCPVPSTLSPSTLTLEKIKRDINWRGVETIFNWEALVASLGWYGLSLVLQAIVPATEAQGTELRSGGRLKYKLNTFLSSLFIVTLLAGGTIVQGAEFPVWIFISNNFPQLFTANLLISFSLAVFVYIRSFSVPKSNAHNPDHRELALGGNTGNVIYDWFIGRELNPRIKIPLIGEIDIKVFMEMRPGLLGWIVIDFAMVAQQYRNYGKVTDSLLLSVVAQTWYVFDSYYMEPSMLTTIDITTDGFGFMLSFGDVAWVPFIYSLQARYLATYPVELGSYATITFAALGTGYYIFRATNNEKNRFRTNPNDPRIKHLKYIQTSQGSKLLVSGWWGRARHINYLGDWIMSWAYCLPTGIAGYQVLTHSSIPKEFPSDAKLIYGDKPNQLTVIYQGDAKGWGMLITYFFMLYFAVLLIHRERRDEAKCRAKYGKDWEEYCRRVPWRIVPYVY